MSRKKVKKSGKPKGELKGKLKDASDTTSFVRKRKRAKLAALFEVGQVFVGKRTTYDDKPYSCEYTIIDKYKDPYSKEPFLKVRAVGIKGGKKFDSIFTSSESHFSTLAIVPKPKSVQMTKPPPKQSKVLSAHNVVALADKPKPKHNTTKTTSVKKKPITKPRATTPTAKANLPTSPKGGYITAGGVTAEVKHVGPKGSHKSQTVVRPKADMTKPVYVQEHTRYLPKKKKPKK